MKTKTFFWLRLWSLIIDISVIYSVTILLQAIIWTFTYVAFSSLFVIDLLTYYVICYLANDGGTLAKRLAGLKITTKSSNSSTLKVIIVREILLKGTLGIIAPLFIFKAFFPIWSLLQTAIAAILILVVSIILLLIFKRPWWEHISATCTVRDTQKGKGRKAAFLWTATTLIAAIIVINYPYSVKHHNFNRTYSPPYPTTKETTQYAQFIKQHRQDPVDYIFDLFKTHDVVVLSERIHSEYTQYDLIKKIVSDQRFIENVGNLFTECGSVSFQDTLSSYLHKSFASEDELNRSTAILQRNSNAVWPLWTNTNLFDLLKTVNRVNEQLPDTSKINWYFTDLPVDWRTMTHEKFLTAYTTPQRDSIMADHIIGPYKKRITQHPRHKALVIMNSRHGYGLQNKCLNPRFAAEYLGTTAYLMKYLPGKVANVMLNSISIKYGTMLTPVQNGKWDRAFALVGNPDAGFNFNKSPFGKDQFDAAFFTAPHVRYQDIFTGFIFYKPLEQHIQKDGFPYELEGFEDTILRRASCVSAASVQSFKARIRRSKQHLHDIVTTDPLGYSILYNLVTVRAASALLLTSLIIAVLLLIFCNKEKTYKTKSS